MSSGLFELLRCPRCSEQLRGSGSGGDTECSACGTSFPAVGGIPCLFPEPTRKLDEWRRQAQRFVELLGHSVSAMDEHLERADLLPGTRQRLQRTRAANARNGERLAQLFSAAGLAPDSRAKASEHEFSLIEYYEQILRDWAWEGGQHRENAEAAELVAATLGEDTRLGRMLVLGAGPCRLTYDLHTRFAPAATVALDINPLLLLAARQVMFGDGLDLSEFPQDPRNLGSVVVDHQLRAPDGKPERLHLVLADAFTAPLARGAFDTVLTPWFIDIVPVDLRETISLVHQLLAPGGRWLQYGPLSYPKEHSHAQRYSQEELYELVRLAGFELGEPRVTRLEYMSSAASSRTKTHEVITFAARKPATPPPPSPELPAGEKPPAWLVLSHLPIPRFTGLDRYKPDHPLLGYLVGLIDGQRTLADLAARMVKDHGARADAALIGTRAMLALVLAAVRNPPP